MSTSRLRKSKIVISMFTIFSMAFGFMGLVPPANAALQTVGPILDPVNNGYPQFYGDSNGIALQLCLDQSPAGLCILTPEFDPTIPGFLPIGQVSGGATAFPEESFYYHASVDLSPNQDIKILWFAALEQAFLAGIVPGTQNIFLRSQVDISGLVPGETYNFTTPYGPMSVVADAVGRGRTRFEDLGSCVTLPTGLFCTFADPSPAVNPVLGAATTNIGPFLQWDPAIAPFAPAGFIGDPNINHAVIGGPNGNSVTVTGLNVGGVGVNTLTTNQFSISGKLADTVPPVITITGGTPFNVTAGTAYVEPGATALDNFDGVIDPATITNVSTVPAGPLALLTGPFTVTYTAKDKAGNIATAVRTVNVVPDTVPPVITLNGATTTNIKVGAAFTDAGATAIDNVDGVVTVSATGTVNTAIAGVYTITYTATDSSLNTATVVRTVNVAADVTAPVITITGGNISNVSQGEVYTDAGATALDDFDGVITTTVVSGLPINTAATGTFSVVYSATDLSGNTSTATRTVNVVLDATPPVITIVGANPATVLVGATYTDQGATAVDNIDGPLAPANIVTTGLGFSTAAVGTFSVVYTATDSAGNVSTATRTVNVTNDADAPVITINGANPVIMKAGTAFVDEGATAIDAISGTVPVTSSGTVDIATVGNYAITYTAVDAAGNIATAVRNVTVVTASAGGGGGGGGTFGGGGGSFIPTNVVNTPVVDDNPSTGNGNGNDDDVVVLGEEADLREIQIQKINNEAEWFDDNNLTVIMQNVQAVRNAGAETDARNKYLPQLLANMPNLTDEDISAMINFIVYGSETSKKLGAGERAGVLNSYKAAFGKLPTGDSDWRDVLKIAVGRFPGQTSAQAETRAKADFKMIYKRDANMSNEKDKAAVNVMAYGLRPDMRNFDSERNANRIFTAIFKKAPSSAVDWDKVRAIAYSGATR